MTTNLGIAAIKYYVKTSMDIEDFHFTKCFCISKCIMIALVVFELILFVESYHVDYVMISPHIWKARPCEMGENSILTRPMMFGS